MTKTPTKAIVSYMHCRQCVTEGRAGQIAVGATGEGHLQVWCETHDRHIYTLYDVFKPDEIGPCQVCGDDGKRQ